MSARTAGQGVARRLDPTPAALGGGGGRRRLGASVGHGPCLAGHDQTPEPSERWVGALDRNRTCGLPLRRRSLYPTELRGRDRRETWERTSRAPSRHCDVDATWLLLGASSCFGARYAARTPVWARGSEGRGRRARLRGERVGRVARRSRVAVYGEAVHGERVGQQVQLPGMSSSTEWRFQCRWWTPSGINLVRTASGHDHHRPDGRRGRARGRDLHQVTHDSMGLAAGDAAGTTLEFKSPGSFEPITDMDRGGPFHLPAGAWTDDTSMAQARTFGGLTWRAMPAQRLNMRPCDTET